MQLSFQYGSRTIDFNVTYSNRRKTLAISVEPPEVINVVAPENTPEKLILEKVKAKSNWIVQKLFLLKDMEYTPLNKEYVSGESFMYLGRNYSLVIIVDERVKVPCVRLYQGKFQITTPEKDEEIIKEAMSGWYWRKAKEKVQERIAYYQYYFKKKPEKVKIKEQQKRWGSCTGKDELLFNWRCVMAPSPVLDYIVVHEMCHLYYKNHSQDYWDLLASILPDYESRKEWLRNYGVRMDL